MTHSIREDILRATFAAFDQVGTAPPKALSCVFAETLPPKMVLLDTSAPVCIKLKVDDSEVNEVIQELQRIRRGLGYGAVFRGIEMDLMILCWAQLRASCIATAHLDGR